ncbi:heterokaryon incompatibility protein-domain-containing protein, partial [Phaeosphaeriaceae sp. PMI808]
IRVMRLHPAEDFDSELICNILGVQFESDGFPDYEAISYAWEGQRPNEDQYIICEDDNTKPRKLLITRNSAIALRHLRKKDDVRILWMDSICIDQSSIQDRNHQVQLMGDIYTRAQRVLIWLG